MFIKCDTKTNLFTAPIMFVMFSIYIGAISCEWNDKKLLLKFFLM